MSYNADNRVGQWMLMRGVAVWKAHLMSDTGSNAQRHIILVVEDEVLIRELVRDHLSDVGFEVVVASNADEARDIIATRDMIELVLTDINMPGSMDGSQLANWLKSYAPHLPVILVSGRASVPESARERRWFLRKPFQLDALEDRIRRLLDK